MRHGLGKTLAVALAAGLVIAAPASAATLADWEMNEAPGAHTMADSSGHVNGTIGAAVKTGVKVQGATAYRWVFASPTAPPPKPERLVQASSSTLNPGSGTYSVTLRYRTTKHFGNIVQKGQAGAKGGYFKLENPHGRLKCTFRGVSSSGSLQRKAVESGVISNGAWHTVVCTRAAKGLTLTVDGKVVDTAKGSTGTISNTRPVTIGGKLNCNQVKTTCDYFTGDIDYIKIAN